ncbi:calcium-binding protein [Nostoc sphaeroides]|uniref:Calcium-binding protein n=1 Tax=Nostoc sphaeroides CCNUC1 TaxID=2653204 RepID=A0A5P8WFM4_9NOSO|nr:calcium-binding protein [Nostoc sphaeroides]QFS51474.1 calcium-binding protein [Nostoc sphaeroides CCNUC1]
MNVGSSLGNNLLSGGTGNDSFNVSVASLFYYSSPKLVTQTLDGGKGDDYLSVDYSNYSSITEGITTSFNATTKIGSITAGTNRVSYKNIERLDILGTRYDDLIVGTNGNDTFSRGDGGNDTLDGGKGEDLLFVDYSSVTEGMISTVNATAKVGSITAGTNRVSYKNIEQLNILGTGYDDLIVGSNGNDTLSGGYGGNDTLDGGLGDDLLSVGYYNAGIRMIFDTTTNIGSITVGTNLVSYKNIERLNISGTDYDDLIMGSNGNDTIARFSGGNDTIDGGLGDDLLSVGYSPYPGIVTEGITTNFDTTNNIGSITTGTNLVSYKNIEQLNISGTQYDDLIVGSNGNDTLSGGDNGNDTIIGGAGNDYLDTRSSTSLGNNLLSGGDGNDFLSAYNTYGNNILNGGDGDDFFNFVIDPSDLVTQTVDGGTGDDTLSCIYYTTEGITTSFNTTTNIGSITQGTNQPGLTQLAQCDR